MAKKSYLVMPRNTQTMEGGLKTTKGTLDFKGQTSMHISDETLAREVDTEHGLKGKGDVWVAQDERAEWHMQHDLETDGQNHAKGGHRYFFGQSNSRAMLDFWERYEKKKRKNAK